MSVCYRLEDESCGLLAEEFRQKLAQRGFDIQPETSRRFLITNQNAGHLLCLVSEEDGKVYEFVANAVSDNDYDDILEAIEDICGHVLSEHDEGFFEDEDTEEEDELKERGGRAKVRSPRLYTGLEATTTMSQKMHTLRRLIQARQDAEDLAVSIKTTIALWRKLPLEALEEEADDCAEEARVLADRLSPETAQLWRAKSAAVPSPASSTARSRSTGSTAPTKLRCGMPKAGSGTTTLLSSTFGAHTAASPDRPRSAWRTSDGTDP